MKSINEWKVYILSMISMVGNKVINWNISEMYIWHWTWRESLRSEWNCKTAAAYHVWCCGLTVTNLVLPNTKQTQSVSVLLCLSTARTMTNTDMRIQTSLSLLHSEMSRTERSWQIFWTFSTSRARHWRITSLLLPR